MAAEMISSALAQEAINQLLSRAKERYEEKSDAREHMERMEMAHIKLEAALETSNKWNVTSVPLLRWQSKLKRAAEECDHTLRRCRQRLQEEEEEQRGVRSASFPMRIAHTTRSFVSSIFSSLGDDDEELQTRSTAVRRFERFADGASEFLRYVELGGTPRRYMFFDPLIRHLLMGKGTKYCLVRGSQHLSFLLQPYSPPDHGMLGSLLCLLEDANAPVNNFILALHLRLSESTDILGVAVRCLQLFMPHLSSTAETVKTKLTQVPTQDLSWISDASSVFGCYNEQQANVHTVCSKWFRPNQLCCQRQDHHYAHGYNATRSITESLASNMYLEPVILVYLLGHVSLSVGNNRQSAVVNGDCQTSCPTGEFPYLKLGVHFWPHASSEDLSPAVGGSASEMMIKGEATQSESGMYANVSFEQLGEMMIPKAVDCLHRNMAETSYQTLWKSKHGSAYLRVDKISGRATTIKDRVGKCPKHQRDRKVPIQGWTSANSEFMSSWIAYAPSQLKELVVDYWAPKEKRQTLPLLLRTNSCVHDCPIKLWSSLDHRYLARKIKLARMFNA